MSAALDPKLASILDSIRLTLAADSSADPQADDADALVADARGDTPPPARAAPLPGRQHSVEEFLADLIRPQVNAWLARHLPEVVQSLVQAEIARLTGATEKPTEKSTERPAEGPAPE